ncbi:MBL fold metallo-hydrolase [Lysinibacillus sp. KU-BSD001]|uniref:MBL fold metallo-hydrolase n=1 Tax=Lysinibacillus sp. KU-BSD001 TaxID=3141328 RepID=UPI0036F2C4EF
MKEKEFYAVEKVSFKDLLKWRVERFLKKKDLSFQVPHIEKVDTEFIGSNRQVTAVTWIGHATFLIQMKGLNILSDPVWASRLGFEKRLTKPGVPIEHIPDIDIVLISHNHYDHLDFRTLIKLKGNPLFLVPKGLKITFLRKGLNNTKEFSWWDSMFHKGLKISFIPSLHWSRRNLNDLNKSLWGGWMIEGDKANIYFVGDSGYHNGFKQIGRQFKVDCVLMPIGSYEPEWFMESQHLTPEQAVQGYQDLKADLFIPMHYDSFRLADDTPKEALDRLVAKWHNKRLDMENLKILKLGETLVF